MRRGGRRRGARRRSAARTGAGLGAPAAAALVALLGLSLPGEASGETDAALRPELGGPAEPEAGRGTALLELLGATGSGTAPDLRLREAAFRIAKAVESRPRAIRKGAESLAGRKVELRLGAGAVSGEIREVTDEGIVLVSEYRIDGQTRSRTALLQWAALRADQLDELAERGGWQVEPADRAAARACIAYASGDFEAAAAAADETAGHVLAERIKARVAAARTASAYAAAIDRARSRMRLKEWKGALRAAEEALAARPGDEEAQRLLAEAARAAAMDRARSRARLADWKGAIEAAEEALRARPGDEEAERLLALATSELRAASGLVLDFGGGVSMELVYVKPGVFMMGGGDDPRFTEHSWTGVVTPRHEVTITRGFFLGKYEVTVRQFAAFVAATGYRTQAEKEGFSTGRRPDGSFGELPGASWRDTTIFPQTDDHPVVCVSWDDAKAFCAWASKATGRDVRLPTEAEWEFACRAGSTTHYVAGDSERDLGPYGWYSGNAGWRTHPVGQKRPNAWGLYDMHGNAWEWVEDWYDPAYYARSPARDPPGPARGNRGVLRGGGWHGGGHCCGSPFRRLEGHAYNEPDAGFRIAVTAPPR